MVKNFSVPLNTNSSRADAIVAKAKGRSDQSQQMTDESPASVKSGKLKTIQNMRGKAETPVQHSTSFMKTPKEK